MTEYKLLYRCNYRRGCQHEEFYGEILEKRICPCCSSLLEPFVSYKDDKVGLSYYCFGSDTCSFEVEFVEHLIPKRFCRKCGKETQVYVETIDKKQIKQSEEKQNEN